MLVALLLAAASAVTAEPICADRPGAANPSCTVPAGMVQVETGLVAWARDRSGGVRGDELVAGETAVKVGLGSRLHVELGLVPYVRTRVSDGTMRETRSGFGDMGVGLKWRLTGDASPVGAALYPTVKLPTAGRTLGNGKVEGAIALLVDGPIGDSAFGWNIAPELGLAADEDGSGHHPVMVQALSIGAGLSERASAALDLRGEWDWDPAGTVRSFSIGPSLAYLLSNDSQLDFGVDLGLSRAAPDIAVYSGVAVRF